MEAKILAELNTIKYIGIAILCCLVLIVFYVSFMVRNIGRNNKAALENKSKERFFLEAQRLEDSGAYKELYNLALERYEQFPNDPTALWYLGLASFRNKEWGSSLSAFKELQKLDQAWQKYEVEEYIEQIQSNLTGPKR